MRIALFAAMALSVSFAGADIGEGNWEMEVTTTMPGAPPATAKQTHCVTAEDAKDPGKLFGNPGGGCDFRNRQDTGSVYSFEIACSGAAPLAGTGEIRYGRDTMDGEIVLKMNAEGKAMETRSRIKARRTGACK